MLDKLQGEAQCCVTGAAFEHMLQLGDPSLLESVMRNVVVFSRMKSHQKGQVMDLLGSTGLHLNVGGHQQHLPVSYTCEVLQLLLTCIVFLTSPALCLVALHAQAYQFLHAVMDTQQQNCDVQVCTCLQTATVQ